MRLLNTPPVGLMESPGSWFSRLALSQHASLRDIRNLFGMPRTRDWDFFFTRKSLSRLVLGRLDLSSSDWKLADHQVRFRQIEIVLGRLPSVDRNGKRFLLGTRDRPQYRYCPVCLASDRLPYFRVEWRFRCWHWCPLHSCLLRDRCGACGQRIVLPVEMDTAGPERAGVALLSRCMSCEHFLPYGWQQEANSVPEEHMNPLEYCLLMNGRAVLSGLWSGYIYDGDPECVAEIEKMRKYERLQVIPNGTCPIDLLRFNERMRDGTPNSDGQPQPE